MVFGDMVFDADKMEEMRDSRRRWDAAYVPGYSEERQNNEIAAAKGKPQVEIDRLQWMRVAKLDGKETDLRDRGEFARLGYQYCTEEDLVERGWSLPPTAYIAPDGTIRREDSALMIVDKKLARRNREEQEEEKLEFMGDRGNADDYAAEGVDYVPGSKSQRVSLGDLTNFDASD
jgi:hypothetical protein